MKHNKFIWLLLFILMAVNSNYSQTEKPESAKKVYEVLVMPFDDTERYPYAMDQVRESFIYGFRSNGFNVNTNDSTWSNILEKNDFYLANISTDMAKQIGEDAQVDLVVFGNATPFSNVRSPGSYSRKIIYKPVLIKVYDVNKNELVLFDRSNFYQYDGLRVKVNDIYDNALEVARKLTAMGY